MDNKNIGASVAFVKDTPKVNAGEIGIIARIIDENKIEVKLDGGTKVCCNFIDVEAFEPVQTIGEKPPIKIELKAISPQQKAANRAVSIANSAIDFDAIFDEEARLEKQIKTYKEKIEECGKKIKQLKQLPELADRHARRVAKMKISDAAAIVEVASIEQLKQFAKNKKNE